MKQTVKDFIQKHKQVSFNEICLFLKIDANKHSDNAKIRQLDEILRNLIKEDFAIYYNGKYCLIKSWFRLTFRQPETLTKTGKMA